MKYCSRFRFRSFWIVISPTHLLKSKHHLSSISHLSLQDVSGSHILTQATRSTLSSKSNWIETNRNLLFVNTSILVHGSHIKWSRLDAVIPLITERVLTFESVAEILTQVTVQMKAIKQYSVAVSVVLFIMPYQVILHLSLRSLVITWKQKYGNEPLHATNLCYVKCMCM